VVGADINDIENENDEIRERMIYMAIMTVDF
jgi:hypothetical protein